MLKRVEKTLEKERQRDNRVYFCLAFHGNSQRQGHKCRSNSDFPWMAENNEP